jgi:hypothetical protein
LNHTQEYGHASTAEVVEQLESMLAEARIEAELNRKGEYVNEVTAGREMASVIYRFTLDEAVSA